MGYKSKYKGSEIDSLLDKAKNDYEVKEYADYAGYNADTSRPSNTISFIEQDNSVWVRGKQYSQNAGCFVGSDASGVPNPAWYLAGVAEMGAYTEELHIIGSVQRTIFAATDKGIFAIDIRKESSGTSKHAMRWFAKLGSNCPKLRLVVDGTSVKLYCQVYGGRYNFAHIQFYDNVGRFREASTAKFVLTDNTTPETTEPVGTDIADAPYLLTNGTAASAIKATTATTADVANKTKYPIVFKRNGASITNWFANTTFTIDIPEELLDYSAPTGITLKVPEISVANKVANKLSLTVNGSTTEYDGSKGARVSIEANRTYIVKANSNSSLGTLYPEQTGHPSAVTVPISILPLEPYNSAAGGLNDGDTLILHIPNSMSIPTANYVWCVKLDITKENATDNIIPLIHGQSAGTPAFWNTSTTIPAGFYQFVYSATLGGLVYMYGNTSTT